MISSEKRKRFGTPPPKPSYPVEIAAAQYLKKQRYVDMVWSPREARAFGFFIDYLRRLQLTELNQINVDFINKLRHNIIQCYFEGALNSQFLYLVSTSIDQFLISSTDGSLVPLFYDDEIYDLTQERIKVSHFDEDAFEDTLSDLRHSQLYTESSLLEVVRYLGLTLKEAMSLNASLSIDYARKHECIVIRNQDMQSSRRVAVWNEAQMTSLTRLATNRLIHDKDEEYRKKVYAYLFSPLSQVYKHLSNNGLSLYALRRAYFYEEFYRTADAEMKPNEIVAHSFAVSRLLGHQFCFDEKSLLLESMSEQKIDAAQSILHKHPMIFHVPKPIADYISDYLSKAQE